MNYDKIADRYDDGYSSPFFSQEDEAISAMLRNRVGSILDIGCGTGLGIKISGASKDEYLGIDVSGKIIEVAKKNDGFDDFNTPPAQKTQPKKQPSYEEEISIEDLPFNK